MDKKIGIWGWWQGGNLGDNWIKNVLESYFPNASFLPTSVQDFTEYDYIICGGGGLFIHDVINPFKKVDIGVPYGILGMGAEFEHESDLASRLEKHADFFLVRDQYSIDCMHLSNACRSYDITFLRPLEFASFEKVNMNKLFFVWRDGNDLIKNNKFNKYILPNDTNEKWFEYINKNFAEITADDFQTNEWNLAERMGECGFVISGRYHGIVAAIQRGIPFVAIDICPKIRALTQECGLEEYCIKISEVDKIEGIVEKAKREIKDIRVKEQEYREKAHSTLVEQMKQVFFWVENRVSSMKVLHYGSYWMGENDVVNVMSDDLLKECDAVNIDLKAYSNCPDKRIESIEKTPNGTICRLSTQHVMKDINEYNPDAIVLNSGGLCMQPDLIQKLKEKNIVSVGISLSDPDVYPYNGKEYAQDFSIFYTNSKYSLNNQYETEKVNVKLLPFAASVSHHYFMPEIEKKYDIVVVGHARKDRIEVVKRLGQICKVGLYGIGWEDGLGVVNGIEHVKAINSGKMYLSFSHTMAGYDNVKVGVFEAMACNQVVITSYMDELADYFEIGKEILCYKTEEELMDLVLYYSQHDDEREAIRNAGYKRFLAEHTYRKRWKKLLRDIGEVITQTED